MRHLTPVTIAIIVALLICSCANHSKNTVASRSIIYGSARFEGSKAYCLKHDIQMNLRPELEGPAIVDLPKRFENHHWEEFPNDGYFYPACTSSKGENVWVCEGCEKKSAEIKRRFKVE